MELPIVERLRACLGVDNDPPDDLLAIEAADLIEALAEALEPQFSQNMLGDILFGKCADNELIKLTMPVGHYRAICAALALAKGDGGCGKP